MSVWYDGENLNTYKGDYGIITFLGLPVNKNYTAYFSVKSTTSNQILLETSAPVEKYWADDEGDEIPMLPGETSEQYEERCEELASLNPPQAFHYGKTKIVLLPTMTDSLPVLKNEEFAKFYFGLKVCCASDGDEDTLIPAVIIDEETQIPHFEEAPLFIVRQKYVEGLLPFKQYCDDMNDAEKNPKDYGLQPLLTEGTGIDIDINNIISCTKTFKLEDLTNVKIENLQDGDVLAFDSASNKWINKQI